MWQLIIRLLVGAGLFYAVKELFSSGEVKVTEKSDCNYRFLNFNNSISINQDKKSNLVSAHNAIRDKLTNYFTNYPYIPHIQFFIQGSYKMATVVENMNQFSDVDLGIYFQGRPNIDISTIQWHIKEALIGHTSKGIEVKKHCVRLNYVRDFHIDLPIYYQDFYGNIYFGAKGEGWQKSDPKEFINWFNDLTRNKPQLVRIIRYLKAWADYRMHQMNKKFPSGLVLTLWVIKHYEKDQRDDVAFVYTCDKVLQYLNENYQYSWEARMPVAPHDNALNRLSDNQKKYFYDDFKTMVENSINAISASNNTSAKDIWKQIFGQRFY